MKPGIRGRGQERLLPPGLLGKAGRQAASARLVIVGLAPAGYPQAPRRDVVSRRANVGAAGMFGTCPSVTVWMGEHGPTTNATIPRRRVTLAAPFAAWPTHTVMACAGPPSTSFPRSALQIVGGGSAPAMTWRDQCAAPDDAVIIARRLLTRESGQNLSCRCRSGRPRGAWAGSQTMPRYKALKPSRCKCSTGAAAGARTAPCSPHPRWQSRKSP